MKFFSLLIFSLATAAISAVPVTFKVNMGVKAAEGLFNPASDMVEVRGAFNAWGAGSALTDANGDRIYEGEFELDDVTVGTPQEYKFAFVKGSDASVVWESISNRSFTPTNTAQTLDTVFFNNDDVISATVKGEISFSVNMSVQAGSTNFNKATDQVYVRGNKMGWGAPPEGLQLFEDATRPGIYTNTYKIDSILAGDLVEYKFTIWKPETSFTGWEDGTNKTLTFSGTELDTDGDTYLEQSVGPVYFNGVGPSDALTEDTEVTFSVDMSEASRLDGTPFDPGFEGVWLNGNFANWWTWGSAPAEYQLLDDGTNGDTNASDLIYSIKLTLPRGTGRMLDYKYAIDSLDNEAVFANNHVRYVRSVGSYTLPRDTFGQMVKETPDGVPVEVGQISIRKAENGNVTLSWPSGPGIGAQKTSSLMTPGWSTVSGSVGASTVTVPADGKTGFFRLILP
jgi:hypothetical protein